MKKICKNCSIEFDGRRNQLYCTIKCKSEYNNEIARKRNEPYQLKLNQVKKNEQLLASIYERYRNQEFPVYFLEQKGFHFNGITGLGKNNEVVVMNYTLILIDRDFAIIKKIK